MEQFRLAQKRAFGTSSEKSNEDVLEQMSLYLFNEAEMYPEESAATTVAKHERKKRSCKLQDILPENIEVEEVQHELPEEERVCPSCGKVLVPIGKEVHRSLVFIPAQAKIREDIYYTYGCEDWDCKKERTQAYIVKTPKVPPVIPGSFASAEAIAHIMTQKFVMCAPLYRQEQELNRAGINLSRQTMSNWILRAAEDWLMPIYDELHRNLLERQVLHADETTLQVLREDGKKAQSKSYMWLYRTSGDAEMPIVLYDYQPNRKAENAKEFLKGFAGYLHADGYPGYHKLQPEISVVGCWAHARRKFDEAVNALQEKDREGAAALEGQRFCSALFAIEESLSALSPEERYKQRLEREKPVLDALSAWANSLIAKTPPKSALGRALYYLFEQWPYLVRYLEDGRCELSNNRAERSIKPFVICRKNFLFANTPGGAKGSATIYSLIETAKENGLDPYRYLLWVLREAPVLSQKDDAWAEKLTPSLAPEECKTPTK